MQQDIITAENLQSSLNRARFPRLGVVLAVRYSDTLDHRWRQSTGQPRASWCEVVVQIVDGGQGDSEETLVATVPSATPGGLLSRSERPIRACSMTLDGTSFVSGGVPLQSRIALDGDWCIVDFLGGMRDKAYVVGWMPHPANQTDLATEGNRTSVGSSQRTLDQRDRWYEKIQGIDVVVTPQGDVYVDTATAGEDLKGAAGGYEKQQLPGHGRFLFSATGDWEWNFNPAVEDPSVPWVPQANPPEGGTSATGVAAVGAGSDNMSPFAAQAQALAVQQEAARIAQAAADAAKALALRGAAVLVPPALAAAETAQAAYDTMAAALDVEARAAQAVATARHAADIALSLLPIPDPEAVKRLAAEAQATAMGAARLAARAQAATVAAAQTAATEIQALAAEAVAAQAAAAQGPTPYNRDVTRLDTHGQLVRARTVVRWNDDEVRLVAGAVARLMARGGADSIEVGGTPEDLPTHHATLAEPLRTAFNANADVTDGLVDAVNRALLCLGLAPYVATASEFPPEAQSGVVKVK